MAIQMCVQWNSWGKEAFEKSKKEKKPILLGLSAVWCHWCHEMDKNYADPEICKLIQERFIPVRVDIDARPDISNRYHQGGFPSTVVLNSSGALLSGGTYFPKEQFQEFLTSLSDYYKSNYEKSETFDSKPMFIRQNFPKTGFKEDEVSGIPQQVTNYLIESYDDENGGFGYQPKFPLPEAVELLILQYLKTKNERYKEMILKTLEGMASLHDLEGGFYRYSVSPDWKIPHYEKMLESNAKLILNYFYAGRLFEKPEFEAIAIKSLQFLEKNFLKKNFSFSGSQDADELYYSKNLEERKQLKAPYIDDHSYTDTTALAAKSFLVIGKIKNNLRFMQIGLNSIDFLFTAMMKNGKLMHLFNGKTNEPELSGFLQDYLQVIDLLLEAYQLIGTKKYLEKAEELMHTTQKDFFEGPETGFSDISISDSEGFLKFKDQPFNENSLAIENLVKLHYITGKEEYGTLASKLIQTFANGIHAFNFNSSSFALAVELSLNPIKIQLQGDACSKEASLILNPAIEIIDPRKLIVFEKTQNLIQNTHVSATVCYGTACSPKVMNGIQLRKMMDTIVYQKQNP